MTKLFTIGFTKKNASQFFELLRDSGATELIDTRLSNVSQLAGFTKREDLRYFARELCDMSYRHELQLAPSAEILQAYKKGRLSWADYEVQYIELIRRRNVEEILNPLDYANGVLLCSEATPEKCHRRLAAEYLSLTWGGMEIIHL